MALRTSERERLNRLLAFNVTKPSKERVENKEKALVLNGSNSGLKHGRAEPYQFSHMNFVKRRLDGNEVATDMLF